MNNIKNLQIVPLFGLDQASTKYTTQKIRIQDKVNTSKNNLIEYKNNLNINKKLNFKEYYQLKIVSKELTL